MGLDSLDSGSEDNGTSPGVNSISLGSVLQPGQKGKYRKT